MISNTRRCTKTGVFKPVGAVSLPEKTKVVVSVPAQPVESVGQTPVDAKAFEILARRYDSGQSDVAARHNEHQP